MSRPARVGSCPGHHRAVPQVAPGHPRFRVGNGRRAETDSRADTKAARHRAGPLAQRLRDPAAHLVDLQELVESLAVQQRRSLIAHLGHVELDLEESRNPRMRRAVELRDWLSVLDLYTTQTLQRKLSEQPPGTVLPGDRLGARVVTALHRRLLSALGLEPGTESSRGSLSEGSERVACFVRRLYEGRSFSRLRQIGRAHV